MSSTKNMKTACDVLISLLFCTLLSVLLVHQSSAVWTVFGIGGLWSTRLLYKAADASSQDESSLKWEAGFTNWFIIVKSATSVIGVILMNIFRQQGWYTTNTHFITLFFLNLNIFEAMYRETELGYFANGIVALILMCTIPYSVSTSEILLLAEETRQSNYFVFPLSLSWVTLYTSWNACFSYGDNMSWQTRLVLIPPIIISIYNVKLWLGARVLLLLLHLILRASQVVWFYQPGASALTPVAGSIKNSTVICHLWGKANIFIAIVFAARTCYVPSSLSTSSISGL